MAIQWSDVTAVAPELTATAGGTQTAILADVNAEIKDGQFEFPADADRARKYLAAHLATMSARSGAGGAVQSETVGNVSRSYAVAAATQTSEMLNSTSYGQEYRRQLRRNPRRIGWVI